MGYWFVMVQMYNWSTWRRKKESINSGNHEIIIFDQGNLHIFQIVKVGISLRELILFQLILYASRHINNSSWPRVVQILLISAANTLAINFQLLTSFSSWFRRCFPFSSQNSRTLIWRSSSYSFPLSLARLILIILFQKTSNRTMKLSVRRNSTFVFTRSPM
jgi:hypothetical protein